MEFFFQKNPSKKSEIAIFLQKRCLHACMQTVKFECEINQEFKLGNRAVNYQHYAHMREKHCANISAHLQLSDICMKLHRNKSLLQVL